MDKNLVLAKSRVENKNRDIYELEVLNQAGKIAVIVMSLFAVIFFVTQIFVGGGMNWGLWALVFSADMTLFWVKYIKLRRKHELVMAIAYTILVLVASGLHIHYLLTSSTVL